MASKINKHFKMHYLKKMNFKIKCIVKCRVLSTHRSALVNNNVFAALAVKWNYHKYIKFISTQMYVGVHKFVQHQKARNDRIQVEQVCACW